ncbi:Reverse transcriptase domain [Cinara cedri]|uniref:Reverse transcriptase domain n=1 Tax=Cinara cedri TaxID=506608 RepID=A0A5E4ME33_9HEMI|nr:Reverse transcriptase domain [Cinara cedri]
MVIYAYYHPKVTEFKPVCPKRKLVPRKLKLKKKIESKIEQTLTEDQFGFRKNMGTREAILALRIIIQKRIRKDKQTFIAFMDIEKAFDNVNWKLMFNMMARVGIKQEDRKLLYKLYKDELAVIKIQDNVEEAKINKGVRQGCTLSPIIFKKQ